MSSRVGLCKVLPFAARVSSVGTNVQDGFTRLLEVKGTELVAGHSYKAIVTGSCGHFQHIDRKRKWQRADILATLNGDSSFIGKMHSQWAPYGPWEGIIVMGNWTTGFRGLPFQMILDFTAASTPKDFVIEGRIKDSTLANPAGAFLVEDLAIVLWDKTQIGLESGIEYIETVGGPWDSPYSTQPKALVAADLSVPTAGDWMIYHSAYMTGRHAANNEHVSLEEWITSASNLWNPMAVHDFGNPSAAATTIWIGQQGIRTLTSTSKLRQALFGGYSSGPKGKLWIGEIFAVRLHADQQAFFAPRSVALNFWEMMWAGSPLGTSFSVPYGTEMFLFAHASMDVSSAAHTLNTVVDGGPVHPVSVRAGGGVGGSNLPVTQVAAPDLQEGTHQVEVYGDRLWLDDPKITSPALTAADVQVYGFGFLVNYIPPLKNLETKGPVTAVIPGRETTISTAALPLLPSEPSTPLPIDVSGETREIKIPRGDVITHPKFMQARRIYQLSWTGLSKTDGETLDAFFDGLMDSSGGTFRWQAPGDFADSAWTLDSDTYSYSRDRAGPMTVSFQAFELVFVAP